MHILAYAYLRCAKSNVLCHVVIYIYELSRQLGTNLNLHFPRYKYDDPEFSEVLQKLDSHCQSEFNASILNFAPSMRKFSFLSKRVSLSLFMIPV